MIVGGEKVVLYALTEGGTIPWEVHDDVDQIIHIVQGELSVEIYKSNKILNGIEGETIFIKGGKKHQVRALQNSIAWSEYT